MKPVRLRPRARQDRRDEIRYYRDEAGPKVAAKLVRVLQRALDALEENPAIGSPPWGARSASMHCARGWSTDFP